MDPTLPEISGTGLEINRQTREISFRSGRRGPAKWSSTRGITPNLLLEARTFPDQYLSENHKIYSSLMNDDINATYCIPFPFPWPRKGRECVAFAVTGSTLSH